MVATEEDVKDKAQTPIELKQQELKAVLMAGEDIGKQLKTPDVGDEERTELKTELQLVADKADGLREEISGLEKEAALERKIFNIGRRTFGERKTEEEAPTYRDAAEALVNRPEVKALAAEKNLRNSEYKVEFEFKAPTDPTSANPADALLQGTPRPGIVQAFQYQTRVGDLFAQAQMEGASVPWVFVTDADGNASLVDYADQKPGASITVDVDSVKARKIANSYTVPDDALDDLPGLEATIRSVLLVGPNGIAQKAESQYVNGSGTGTPAEIVGVLSLSPSTFSAGGPGGIVGDVIGASMDIEAETGFPASAVVCNPVDYPSFFFLESSAGFPIQPGQAFWGNLPQAIPQVVRSKEIAPGTLLVGAFNTSILYTRMAVNIRMTNQGLGLTDYNLTLFVAETRQALVHPYAERTYRLVTAFS